jgi:hypothetical protein
MRKIFRKLYFATRVLFTPKPKMKIVVDYRYYDTNLLYLYQLSRKITTENGKVLEIEIETFKKRYNGKLGIIADVTRVEKLAINNLRKSNCIANIGRQLLKNNT